MKTHLMKYASHVTDSSHEVEFLLRRWQSLKLSSNSSCFFFTEGLLPCSKETITVLHSERAKSGLHLPNSFLWYISWYYSLLYTQMSNVIPSFHVFQRNCVSISHIPARVDVTPIPLPFILNSHHNLLKSTSYEVYKCVVFYILLLFILRSKYNLRILSLILILKTLRSSLGRETI
jgi:hypothetical protein